MEYTCSWKLREYPARKAAEKDSRPPWRPVGRATSARPPVKQNSQMGSNKVTRRIIKSALPKPTVERVRLAVTENEPVTGVEPSRNTATTPVTVQTISESPKISIAPIRPSSDDLGLFDMSVVRLLN